MTAVIFSAWLYLFPAAACVSPVRTLPVGVPRVTPVPVRQPPVPDRNS